MREEEESFKVKRGGGAGCGQVTGTRKSGVQEKEQHRWRGRSSACSSEEVRRAGLPLGVQGQRRERGLGAEGVRVQDRWARRALRSGRRAWGHGKMWRTARVSEPVECALHEVQRKPRGGAAVRHSSRGPMSGVWNVAGVAQALDSKFYLKKLKQCKIFFLSLYFFGGTILTLKLLKM